MWQYQFDPSRPQDSGEPVLGFIEYSKSRYGHFRPFHAHPETHILFCVKGRSFLRLNDVELDIRPGMLAVIPANALHSFGPKQEGLEFWGISLTSTASPEQIRSFFLDCEAMTADFSGYLSYVQGAFLFIYETANRLSRMDDQEKRAQADQAIRNQTQTLLYFTESMLTSRPCRHPLPQDRPMDRVIRWMMEHYSENITLDSLAERFALSPSHFSRKFQEAFLISPINYLIDYRISAAKDLLIHTDMPIGRIAAEVGYENPYHFSSLFSRRTGLTPQEMRAICRDEESQPNAVCSDEPG